MANTWLRLWHDMPNDPKWRTIARVSKQSIPEVIAVYVHLLVIASNATERGRTQPNENEDIASALDMETEQVDSIVAAMQGRVLDGDMLTGWSKRQVEREDGAAERSKRWREAQKEAKRTQPNATERKQTHSERKQTPDTDTDTDKTLSAKQPALVAGFDEFWDRYPKKVGKGAAETAWKKAKVNGHLSDVLSALDNQKRSEQWAKDGGQFIPNPSTWINQRRWEDVLPVAGNSAMSADELYKARMKAAL
jgi:hypothetical protein